MGNSHGNFQIQRFTASENIAKSFRGGGYFFDSHCRSKSAISLQRRQFDLKFQVEGFALTNHFRAESWANECLTTLSLTGFTQRNFVADFRQAKCNFTRKTFFCVLSPLWGLRGNVR